VPVLPPVAVGVVALPLEPPVPVVGRAAAPQEPLALPAPRDVEVGSAPASGEPPPPVSAPGPQPAVSDVANGSSRAREREKTLLCFPLARDMS
jgi:hypothetical protein